MIDAQPTLERGFTMECATQGCTAETTGKSKYCPTHRALARQAWIENIAKSSEERAANKVRFAKLHEDASAAGMAAVEAHKPDPMGVTDGTQTWVVEGGACGFAWVNFPGNTKFGAWAKKNAGAKKDYPTGLSIWCPLLTQSMSTKEAYCSAYVKVLNAGDPTIKAHMRSRMD